MQITSNGGGTPLWNRRGGELFFSGSPDVMQSVDITLGDRVQVGTPRTLFTEGDLGSFSVTPDGSRFLAIKSPRVGRLGPAHDLLMVDLQDDHKPVRYVVGVRDRWSRMGR